MYYNDYVKPAYSLFSCSSLYVSSPSPYIFPIRSEQQSRPAVQIFRCSLATLRNLESCCGRVGPSVQEKFVCTRRPCGKSDRLKQLRAEYP